MTEGQSPKDLELSKSIYDIVVDGLRLINGWKTEIIGQLAGKYQSPVDRSILDSLGAKSDNPGIEYERVLRYNYTPEELSCVVDTIAVIKSLCNMLRNADAYLSRALKLNMHNEIQVFCQHTLLPILHRADKKQKAVKAAIWQLRSVVCVGILGLSGISCIAVLGG